MICEYDKEKKILHIKYDGEIDHHTCDKIKIESDYEIQKFSPRKVVFDFGKVNFMDSSGIGMLIGRYKQILRVGGKAEMINVNYDVKRIFEMSGIFKIIPLIERAGV